MKKLSSYISVIFTLFIIGFLSLIVYVALLGDNHKINFAVEQYFADIKSRTFTAPCSSVNSGTILDAEDCRNNFFLLETALLLKYNLIEEKKYSIEIKRGHFWIPFVTDDTVSISVAFTPKKENFIKALINKEKMNYVNDLMTVNKKNKLWQVQSINFESGSLAPVLSRLKKEINMETYITKTEKGYSLNSVEVDYEGLSPLEKRLFEYSIQKLSSQK